MATQDIVNRAFNGAVHDFREVQLPALPGSHVQPTSIAPNITADLNFLNCVRPIGAHSQIDAELSGAFILFMLRHAKDINWNGQYLAPTRIRLQGTQFDHERLTSILQRSLGTGYTVQSTLSSSILLVTFPQQSFPARHRDKNDPNTTSFRILWDFHLRGRVLSSNRRPYHGLFLENCGVEVCSPAMCGKKPHGKFHLHHQGWDLTKRSKGCPLVTARLDVSVSFHNIICGVDETVAAFGSDTFRSILAAEMFKFVYDEMMNFVVSDSSKIDLEKLQHDKHRDMAHEYGLDIASISHDDFVNTELRIYLESLFDDCSDHLAMNRLFGGINL